MLGDCYCCAVVEHLSKRELMACDEVNLCQDVSPGHISASISNVRNSIPELIVVSVDPKQEKLLQ